MSDCSEVRCSHPLVGVNRSLGKNYCKECIDTGRPFKIEPAQSKSKDFQLKARFNHKSKYVIAKVTVLLLATLSCALYAVEFYF